MTEGLLLSAVLAAINPCAPVDPGPTRDTREAAVYLKVGRAEARAGREDSATAAFTEALRRDPDNAEARAGLARLCAAGAGGDSTVDEALTSMNRGDLHAAIAQLARLRPDPSAAMLEGICRYELGDDEQARPLLLAARSDPMLRDHSDLFLGLIDLRAGRAAEAAARLEPVAASSDRALNLAAAPLLRLARREGKLQLSLSAGGGYDSNVDLAPGALTLASGSDDVLASIEGGLALRPWGQQGGFATLSGGYRKLATLPAFDLGLIQGTAGWQLGVGALLGAIEYGYDFLVFGGSPYLTAHHLGASGRLSRQRWSWTASYLARLETYLQDETSGYSGVRQVAATELSYLLAQGTVLGLGYGAAGHLPADGTLRFIEHGPNARVEVPLVSTARLLFSGALRDRTYAADPALAPATADASTFARRDLMLQGELRAELDISAHWSVYLSLDASQVRSNLPELTYGRLATALGVSIAKGWP